MYLIPIRQNGAIKIVFPGFQRDMYGLQLSYRRKKNIVRPRRADGEGGVFFLGGAE